MKFVLNVEYGNYNNINRVTAFEGLYPYFTKKEKKVNCKFHVNAIIKTTIDFDINSDMIQIVSDSCSVQYRPKGLHKNTKGVFYKLNGKPVYLDQKELYELEDFIEHCIDKKETIINK